MLNTILQIQKNFVVDLDLIMVDIEFNTLSHTRKKNKSGLPIHLILINIMEHYSRNVLLNSLNINSTQKKLWEVLNPFCWPLSIHMRCHI